jgi:hypothetical protein
MLDRLEPQELRRDDPGKTEPHMLLPLKPLETQHLALALISDLRHDLDLLADAFRSEGKAKVFDHRERIPKQMPGSALETP